MNKCHLRSGFGRFLALFLCLSLTLPNPAFALREQQTEDKTGLEEIARAFGVVPTKPSVLPELVEGRSTSTAGLEEPADPIPPKTLDKVNIVVLGGKGRFKERLQATNEVLERIARERGTQLLSTSSGVFGQRGLSWASGSMPSIKPDLLIIEPAHHNVKSLGEIIVAALKANPRVHVILVRPPDVDEDYLQNLLGNIYVPETARHIFKTEEWPSSVVQRIGELINQVAPAVGLEEDEPSDSFPEDPDIRRYLNGLLLVAIRDGVDRVNLRLERTSPDALDLVGDLFSGPEGQETLRDDIGQFRIGSSQEFYDSFLLRLKIMAGINQEDSNHFRTLGGTISLEIQERPVKIKLTVSGQGHGAELASLRFHFPKGRPADDAEESTAGLEEDTGSSGRINRRRFFGRAGEKAAETAVTAVSGSSAPSAHPGLNTEQFEAVQDLLEALRRLDSEGLSGFIGYLPFNQLFRDRQAAVDAVAHLPAEDLQRKQVEDGVRHWDQLIDTYSAEEPKPDENGGFSRNELYFVAQSMRNVRAGGDDSLWWEVVEKLRRLKRRYGGHALIRNLSFLQEYNRAVAAGLNPATYVANVERQYVEPLVRKINQVTRSRLESSGLNFSGKEIEDALSNPPENLEEATLESWVRTRRDRALSARQKEIRKRLSSKRFDRVSVSEDFPERPEGPLSLDEAAQQYEEHFERALLQDRLKKRLAAALRRQHRLGARITKEQFREELARVDQQNLGQLKSVLAPQYVQERLVQFPIPGLQEEFLQGASSSAVGWLAARLAQRAASGPVDLWVHTDSDGSIYAMVWRKENGFKTRVPRSKILELESAGWNLEEEEGSRRFLGRAGTHYQIHIPEGISAATLDRELWRTGWWDYPARNRKGIVKVEFKSAILLLAPTSDVEQTAAGLEEVYRSSQRQGTPASPLSPDVTGRYRYPEDSSNGTLEIPTAPGETVFLLGSAPYSAFLRAETDRVAVLHEGFELKTTLPNMQAPLNVEVRLPSTQWEAADRQPVVVIQIGPQKEQLVTVTRTAAGLQFQSSQSFTVLKLTPVLSMRSIVEVPAGLEENAPQVPPLRSVLKKLLSFDNQENRFKLWAVSPVGQILLGNSYIERRGGLRRLSQEPIVYAPTAEAGRQGPLPLSKELQDTLAEPGVQQMLFSPDGQRIFVRSKYNAPEVRIWEKLQAYDWTTGQQVATVPIYLTGLQDIQNMVLSPDGKKMHLLSASLHAPEKAVIRTLDFSRFEVIGNGTNFPVPSREDVWPVAVLANPDGDRLHVYYTPLYSGPGVIATYRQSTQSWSETVVQIQEGMASSEIPLHLAISRDGGTAYIASVHGEIIPYDLQTGVSGEASFQRGTARRLSLTILSDGALMAVGETVESENGTTIGSGQVRLEVHVSEPVQAADPMAEPPRATPRSGLEENEDELNILRLRKAGNGEEEIITLGEPMDSDTALDIIGRAIWQGGFFAEVEFSLFSSRRRIPYTVRKYTLRDLSRMKPRARKKLIDRVASASDSTHAGKVILSRVRAPSGKLILTVRRYNALMDLENRNGAFVALRERQADLWRLLQKTGTIILRKPVGAANSRWEAAVRFFAERIQSERPKTTVQISSGNAFDDPYLEIRLSGTDMTIEGKAKLSEVTDAWRIFDSGFPTHIEKLHYGKRIEWFDVYENLTVVEEIAEIQAAVAILKKQLRIPGFTGKEITAVIRKLRLFLKDIHPSASIVDTATKITQSDIRDTLTKAWDMVKRAREDFEFGSGPADAGLEEARFYDGFMDQATGEIASGLEELVQNSLVQAGQRRAVAALMPSAGRIFVHSDFPVRDWPGAEEYRFPADPERAVAMLQEMGVTGADIIVLPPSVAPGAEQGYRPAQNVAPIVVLSASGLEEATLQEIGTLARIALNLGGVFRVGLEEWADRVVSSQKNLMSISY